MTWLALACSGPGAMAAIERRESQAWIVFAIAGAALAACIAYLVVRRRTSRWAWVAGGLVALHPAIWMSARAGDCGRMLEIAAIAATVAAVIVAVVAVVRGRTRGSPA